MVSNLFDTAYIDGTSFIKAWRIVDALRMASNRRRALLVDSAAAIRVITLAVILRGSMMDEDVELFHLAQIFE